MQMGSPETGDFRGFEVSLLEALAIRLGRSLSYRKALWSVIIDELASGRLDLICSAATITPERAQRSAFCTPHLHLSLAAVTPEHLDPRSDWSHLRLGVRSGTTAECYLLARVHSPPNLLRSESNDDLYHALANGSLDLLVDDSPIALHFSRTTPGLRYHGPLNDTSAAYAIMLRPDNQDLLGEINLVLSQLEADGSLPTLRQQWFGTHALYIA